MKKITMQDIADELQVSRNTVSRAIRGKGGVSESTRKEIIELAEELGYRYKKVNSSETLTEEGHFVLLISSFALSQASFFGVILDTMKELLTEEECSLEIVEVPTENKKNEYERVLQNLQKRREEIEGIFVVSHITNEFVQKVIALNYPTILVDHHHPALHADAILTQNEFGAYEMVKYLVDRGFKDIGFIGNTAFSPSYRERLVGYEQVLMDNHLDERKEYVLSDVEEDQASLFSRIESLEKLPEAWFCVNSGLAFILNTYLHSKGYKVPEDYSIVCFDDTEFTRRSSPAITCIGTNLKVMAEEAIQMMQERINYPHKQIKEIRIRPELHERQSVQKK